MKKNSKKPSRKNVFLHHALVRIFKLISMNFLRKQKHRFAKNAKPCFCKPMRWETIDEEEGSGGPHPTYDFMRLHLGVLAWQSKAMIKI